MPNLKDFFPPKVPDSPAGKFLLFFLGEVISSLLIVADMRAIQIISYKWTTIINFVFFLMNYWFLRAITKAEKDGDGENFWSALGYVLGGVIGANIGLWLTLRIFGR